MLDKAVETMVQLKARARLWPDPWGKQARQLIADAHFDLMCCRSVHVRAVCEDLRKSLFAVEECMRQGEDV